MLNIFNIQDSIAENKDRWIAHLNRMPDGRLSKKVCQYKPIIDKEVEEDPGSAGGCIASGWERVI